MAITPTRLPLARAQQLANAVRDELAPGCVRIEIAGSIRRRKPDVGDLELVAIPKRSGGLFDDQSALDPILAALEGTGRFRRIKGGDKYKQFEVVKAGVKLDLFLCEPETWGCCFLIRTGPASFNERLVLNQRRGGLCPDDMAFNSLRVWSGARRVDAAVHLEKAVPLETPEEKDVFAALGLAWVEPWRRG